MASDELAVPRRLPPLAVDALFALAVLVLDDALDLVGADPLPPGRRLAVLAGWSVLGALPVLLRRHRPLLAVLAIAAHSIASVLLELNTEDLAVIVLTYSAAAYLSLRAAVAGVSVLWLPTLALVVASGQVTSPPLSLNPVAYLVVNLLTALVLFLAGRVAFNRRRYVAALEGRALAAEANQRTLADQAVADERRRIARELHDMVAHHVSVMGVLATGSRRMLHRDPDAAAEALATIEETGRTALREMRRLLTVLRADAEPAGELAPQPGLAGVEGLVEQIREAGLPATLKVEGRPGPLDPGVALTVYRIVQEALTNALKHAGAAAVEVRLLFGPQELIVEICDTGRGPQLGSGPIGHGLLGMRERVMLYGGTLRTGPRPGGGYRVYAKIPLDVTERQLAS
jgi:signal transduction histidine kinase